MSRFPFLRKAPSVRSPARGLLKITLREALAPLLGEWQGAEIALKFAVIRRKGRRYYLDVGFRQRVGNRKVKTTLRLHIRYGALTAGKDRLPVTYLPNERALDVSGFGKFIRT